MKNKIQWSLIEVDAKDIKPNPGNPKIRNEAGMRRLQKSFQKFGKIFDGICNKDLSLIDGHSRLEINPNGKAKVFVPSRQLNKKDENELNAIFDLARAGDPDVFLMEETFGEEFMEEWELEGKPKQAEEDDFDVPPLDEIKTDIVLGDLFEIGQHRLLCGDSTNADDVEKLMEGKKADVVLSDPPYGMRLNTDWSDAKSSLKFATEKKAFGGKKHREVIGDHEDFKPELITTFFDNFTYCKEIFLFGADYYSDLIPDKNEGSWGVWDKRLDESADKMYGSTFELFWSKAKHKRLIARVKWAGIFGTEKEFDKKRHHPTQKPIGLISWFFEYYSLKDKVNVVDLYFGSAPVLIACHQLNKKFFGIEIDPRYVQIGIDRIKKFDNSLQVKCLNRKFDVEKELKNDVKEPAVSV